MSEILIALLSFAGTLIGSAFGIIANNRLVTYRLEELSRRVEEHNGFARRLPVLEEKIRAMEEKISVLSCKKEPKNF